ncbi:MAG: hypothetical protein US85_C0016G0002 [Candidatus Shapirobacteria bacterium GW2011_GWF1_38_23]|nr:MAG: hypothetical protein US85_C0016G0002 [Candidatus Shapirobacteria bacterium GW2011_GWF1_38_23]
MKKIVIQAGHSNSQYSTLGLGSGAPGEQEVNKRIADRLCALLRERGFSVIQTDANAYGDVNVTGQDHDLFLALHCDADYAGDMGSGFADFPEPSTDGATIESQRICGIFNNNYFPDVGIIYKSRSNSKTRFYYMWQYLSAKTPCVLIEMGQCQDPHDKVLLANTDLIANALGRCVCKSFDVPFDPPVTPEPSVTPPVTPPVIPEPSVIPPDTGLTLIKEIKDVVWDRWTWIGKTNGWKVRLNQLKALLPK